MFSNNLKEFRADDMNCTHQLDVNCTHLRIRLQSYVFSFNYQVMSRWFFNFLAKLAITVMFNYKYNNHENHTIHLPIMSIEIERNEAKKS